MAIVSAIEGDRASSSLMKRARRYSQTEQRTKERTARVHGFQGSPCAPASVMSTYLKAGTTTYAKAA